MKLIIEKLHLEFAPSNLKWIFGIVAFVVIGIITFAVAF